jgi:hypothetical protein
MSAPSLSGVLPEMAFKYQNMPDAIRSKQNSKRYQPVNGSSFVSNSNNLIRIEVRDTGFLDGQSSYLKFSITNNATLGGATAGQANFQGFASAVIQRLRITCGSQVLSDIQQYSQLANFLILNSSSDDYQRILQIVGGADNSADNALIGTQMNVLPSLTTKTYSIPLISGLLSSSKFLPLSMLAGGLVIELTLEPNFYNVFCNATSAVTNPAGASPTYTCSNIEYCAKIVDIEDDNALMYIKNMMMAQGGLKIKTFDYQTHLNSIANGQGNAVITIPDRSSSLKSLITTLHRSTGDYNISTVQGYKFNVSQFAYRVGGTQYPITPITVSDTNLVEYFSEIQKCLNSGLWNMSGRTFADYASAVNNTTYTDFGSFGMAYDFENYNQTDAFSGLNLSTLGLPVNLTMTFSTNTPAALNAVTFANKDVVYVITPDGVISKQE